jgi:hypothetical protein
MAETIQSLGDVPLGRGGTGAAVTFGKVDYGYLDEDKAKKDAYKDYVTSSQYMQVAKKAGAVWSPDQPKVKEALNEWYAAAESLEKARKNKDAEAERTYRKEMLDKQVEIESLVENSKIMEADWKKKDGELTKDDQFYYDEEDRKRHQEYGTLPYDERMKKYGLSLKLDRADDLNILKKEQQDMLAQLGTTKPKYEKATVIKNGKEVTEYRAYYDEQDVREAARRAADKGVLPGSKWERGYKTMLLNITDDPATAENEQEKAAEIINNLPPSGTSPEFKELIAQSYYNTFKDQIAKDGIIIKPYTPPADKRASGGGGGKTPTATYSPKKLTKIQDVYLPSGKVLKETSTLSKIPIASKNENQFKVTSAFAQRLKEADPSTENIMVTDEADPNSFVLTGKVSALYQNPKTKESYIEISPKIGGVTSRTIIIPLSENEAEMELWFTGTEDYQKGRIKTFDEWFKEKMETAAPTTKPLTKQTTAPKPTGGVLRVKAKDGKIYTIPYSNETEKNDKIKAAEARGGTVIQ